MIRSYILSRREKILAIIAGVLLLAFVIAGSSNMAKTAETNTLADQTSLAEPLE